MNRREWLEAQPPEWDCIETYMATCDTCGSECELKFDWCNAMDALYEGYPDEIDKIDRERDMPFTCSDCLEREATEYERQVTSDWYYDRI